MNGVFVYSVDSPENPQFQCTIVPSHSRGIPPHVHESVYSLHGVPRLNSRKDAYATDWLWYAVASHHWISYSVPPVEQGPVSSSGTGRWWWSQRTTGEGPGGQLLNPTTDAKHPDAQSELDDIFATLSQSSDRDV